MELLTSGALWRVAGQEFELKTGCVSGATYVNPNFVYFSPFLCLDNGQYCNCISKPAQNFFALVQACASLCNLEQVKKARKCQSAKVTCFFAQS